MKYIGIIAAIKEERESIENLMTNIKENKIYNLCFITGKINNKNVVLTQCGVGKVNAARVTQILIDNYNLEYIINVGTAGSLNNKIEIGDIVIGEKLIQHDFDVTAAGHEKGYISDLGKYFYSDKKLIERVKTAIQSVDENFNLFVGTIATGDVFIQDIKLKDKIKKEFKPYCVEMEGAAIAQVCTLDKIPFIVIRGISDKPNGKNNIDFETYLKMACERYAKFIDILLK